MAQVVVFSCMSCGHSEKVAREEYEKTETAQQPSLKTIDGRTIVYRPVPDSFECPNCKGDMILRDGFVSTPLDGVIMVSAKYEDLDKVNEEEAQRRRGEENHKRREQALTILKPNIENNIKHLLSLEGVDVFRDGNPFHIDDKHRPTVARINALVSFVGFATRWSPEEAQAVALGVLEEANLHTERRKVKELFDKMNPFKNPLT